MRNPASTRRWWRRRRSRARSTAERVIAFAAVSSDGQLRIHGARPPRSDATTLLVPIATGVPVHVTIGHERSDRAGQHLSTVTVETPDGELHFSDGTTTHAGLLTLTTQSRLEIYADRAPAATQVHVVLEATGEPR